MNIEENTIPTVKIDPVILTPEVVDQFRLNFDNPTEALGRDLIKTMEQDYAPQLEADPNFISWEGLTNGTATILDFLPSTKGKPAAERAYTPDQVVVTFSNAQPATFLRPFLSEFAKSGPATEAMAATARLVGPRLIPASTAAGANLGPVGATIGFTAGLVGTGALSLLTGGTAYLLGDYVEEKIMGPDPVITPGQRAAYEAYRTLGGGVGAIRFPWTFKEGSNLGGNFMLNNLSKEATKTRALALTKGLDNIISSTGKAAKRNPLMTATGELAATGGSGVGAYLAESTDPGATGTRLLGELVGGNLLYSTLSKTLPRVLSSQATEELGGMAVTAKQKKLFENINRLYADYGTEQQYDQLIENLTSPEITQQLQEAFPDVQFTAAQRGGDPFLMGVEAKKASGEPGLDIARKKAERESKEFMNTFIQGLISTGNPQIIKKAAVLRTSVFDDTLRTGLQLRMNKFLKANAKLADQPGQTAVRSKQQLSGQLYEMVGDYLTAASNKEREFWRSVPNVDVIAPMSPDTPAVDLPKFLRAFEDISYVDPAVQDQFSKSAPILFNFIEQARKDLGLTPKPKFSNAEISSSDKFKGEYNNAVAKLTGFPEEKQIISIMEEAKVLPLAERSTYLREQQEQIKATLKDLTSPEGSKRLTVALDKAANYVGVLATNEKRAIQRAGEPSEDVVALTADRLAEVRSKLLRQARALAADPATSDEARKIGVVAEAIAEDLDVDGFGEAYDVARSYTKAKHDFFTRSVVGQVSASQRSGASKFPPEVTFELFVKANPSFTLSRVRQLQGFAEFADQQGLNKYLSEESTLGSNPVFTTTTNLVDSYLRGLKEVASKEVFNPKTGKTTTVINANALEKWKAENADVLEAFPQLKIDLSNASLAQRAVEVMDQNVKSARKIQQKQTFLAKLLDGMSPTFAVANAFESENPVRSFRNLFALRRMGESSIKSREASKTGFFDPKSYKIPNLRSLKIGREKEISAAGLKGDEINEALRTAVLDHAYRAAGGEGSFNPQVFYQTLFGKMPKSNNSLMEVADQFDVFPKTIQNRIKFMSEQLMRVQAADAAGRLTDPDAFAADAGPIMEFYVGVVGSALGTGAFKGVGGKGAGSISAAGVGSRQLRAFILDLPATAKLRAIDMMFTDPPLIAALMQKPTSETGKVNQYKKIITLLNDKLFNTSVTMAPFVVRETFEEEDRGVGSPLAEDPEKEIPALRKQLNQQTISNSSPSNTSQVTPSAQVPTLTPQAQAQPSSGPTDPNTRARYASLFPNDPISGMLNSGGIASLGG